MLPDMYIDLFDGNFTTTKYWTTQGNCDVAYPPATFVWYTLAVNCNNGVSAPPYRANDPGPPAATAVLRTFHFRTDN